MVFIYRQEILQDISLFTSQPKAKFYDELFLNLDLSFIPVNNSKTGRKGYSNHSMICAFIVMKCEGFAQISDLYDYLSNNLIIAHYCGFDIAKELPSYAKFTRFIREFDNDILQALQSDPFVWKNFCLQPELYRRVRINTIQIKKGQPELFKSRLNKFVENTRKGILYGGWNDYGRLWQEKK